MDQELELAAAARGITVHAAVREAVAAWLEAQKGPRG